MFSRPVITPDSPLDLRVVAVASLLLSAWLIAIDPIVSRDAIIYLRAADAYLQQGFFASQQQFGRPLLPVLIATVHQLTGLSLLHAGLLLNSLFYALLCCAFVATVRLLGGGFKVQLFAALVVLSHPLLADYRSSVMRDPAYWAFMMLSLRELLLYMRDPRVRHQLGWFAAVAIATQFRFEGLFFALLVPLVLLLVPGPQSRLRSCLCLLLPQLIVFGALATAVAIYQAANPDIRVFHGIGVYFDRLRDLSAHYQQVVAATGEVMLSFSAREDAAVATNAGLIAVLVLNLCRALGWVWLAVLGYGLWHRLAERMAPLDRALLNAANDLKAFESARSLNTPEAIQRSLIKCEHGQAINAKRDTAQWW